MFYSESLVSRSNSISFSSKAIIIIDKHLCFWLSITHIDIAVQYFFFILPWPQSLLWGKIIVFVSSKVIKTIIGVFLHRLLILSWKFLENRIYVCNQSLSTHYNISNTGYRVRYLLDIDIDTKLEATKVIS